MVSEAASERRHSPANRQTQSIQFSHDTHFVSRTSIIKTLGPSERQPFYIHYDSMTLMAILVLCLFKKKNILTSLCSI